VLFFCSLSEAQKGAEDKVQIKAQLGGMPATSINLHLRNKGNAQFSSNLRLGW